MKVVEFIRKLLFGPQRSGVSPSKGTIYEKKDGIEEIHSIWDYIKLAENTQASHIIAVLGFDEWVPMEEIMRRVKELFHVDYKNDRSLYPYIKTLVDIGLVEAESTGGKKKWRKRDVLIKVKRKRVEDQLEEMETAQAVAR